MDNIRNIAENIIIHPKNIRNTDNDINQLQISSVNTIVSCRIRTVYFSVNVLIM